MSEEKKGKLLTFTVLQMAQEGFEVPLIIGMVELDNGVKLLCNGKCPADKLRIGQEVIVKQEGENTFFWLKK
jgi:uncharacterized OB-fold protein